MPVTVLADLRFSPDALDEGLAALGSMLSDTRGYEGCVRVDVVQDQADEGHVMLIEEGDAPDSHKEYMAWRAQSGSNAGMRAALAQPPTVTYFDQRADL